MFKKFFSVLLIALVFTFQFTLALPETSAKTPTKTVVSTTCDSPANLTVSGYIYKGAESSSGGKTVYVDVLYQNSVVASQTVTASRTYTNYSFDLTDIVPQCSTVSVSVYSPQLTFSVATRTTLLGDSTFDGGSNPTYFANQNQMNFYGE